MEGREPVQDIRIDGDTSCLEGLPGVEKVTDFGREQELRVALSADSQQILAAVMQRTRILGFDIVKPSLHDIFVRIAGPDADRAEVTDPEAVHG